jgi:hypothetical protein
LPADVPDDAWLVPVAVPDLPALVAAVVAVYGSPGTPMMVCATPARTVIFGSVAQLHWPLAEESDAQQNVSLPQLVMSPIVWSAAAPS